MRVVIEVGHGGDDPGAVVAGVHEADLTRAVAQRLAARSDARVSYDLKRRPAGMPSTAALRTLLRALKQNPPDLVVSLHCDAIGRPVELHRCTVRALGSRAASMELAQRMAAAATDPAHQFAQAASVVAAPWMRGGKPFTPGILRYGRQASVLVELGMMDDPHVRAAMQTAAWQERAAAAIDAAVRAWGRC